MLMVANVLLIRDEMVGLENTVRVTNTTKNMHH